MRSVLINVYSFNANTRFLSNKYFSEVEKKLSTQKYVFQACINPPRYKIIFAGYSVYYALFLLLRIIIFDRSISY